MISRAFENALRELDGDFIMTNGVASEYLVTFSNPSIRDFLNATMSSSPLEVEDLIATAVFFEQLSGIWRTRLATTAPASFCRNDVLLANRLRELIGSESSRIKRGYAKDWTVRKLTRDRGSRSEHLLFLLEIAEELQTPATRELVRDLVGDDNDQEIDPESFGKDSLVDLLVRLQKGRAWTAASSRLYGLVRAFLLKDLEAVDDYKTLGAFATAFPSAYDASEWANVQRRLESSFHDWKSTVWYDSDDIWSLYSEMEDVGAVTLLSVRSILFALRCRAEELEEEEEEKPEPSKPYAQTPEKSSDESKEIDALFASLAAR
jgi:hypothetical protein